MNLFPLVDSGVDNCFANQTLARHANIPTEALHQPRTILDLDGRPIATVAHRTMLLNLVLSSNHREKIHLYLIPSSSAGAVFSSPWLVRHNPQFNWTTGALTGWSVLCHAHYLQSAILPLPETSERPVTPPDLSTVPEVYHDPAEGLCFGSSSLQVFHNR